MQLSWDRLVLVQAFNLQVFLIFLPILKSGNGAFQLTGILASLEVTTSLCIPNKDVQSLLVKPPCLFGLCW